MHSYFVSKNKNLQKDSTSSDNIVHSFSLQNIFDDFSAQEIQLNPFSYSKIQKLDVNNDSKISPKISKENKSFIDSELCLSKLNHFEPQNPLDLNNILKDVPTQNHIEKSVNKSSFHEFNNDDNTSSNKVISILNENTSNNQKYKSSNFLQLSSILEDYTSNNFSDYMKTSNKYDIKKSLLLKLYIIKILICILILFAATISVSFVFLWARQPSIQIDNIKQLTITNNSLFKSNNIIYFPLKLNYTVKNSNFYSIYIHSLESKIYLNSSQMYIGAGNTLTTSFKPREQKKLSSRLFVQLNSIDTDLTDLQNKTLSCLNILNNGKMNIFINTSVSFTSIIGSFKSFASSKNIEITCSENTF
ncbi:hypothetical protein BB561_005751 [Smittium simulii]|uniref:Late embryogenesis abundant protein LEA-2 subgroup domain-containing protein n=1 Tax=Smittium simulii TaxID=133385 RepID=A0A2T9Y8M4_9FUNG|nr:hypothetical protein BB561_005751 [Smittium simulii]